MYIFYDLETSDLNRNFSQIFQIGMILADENLDIVEEKEITCRRAPWIIPSPGALLTTGFTDEQMEKDVNSHFDLINELDKWLKDKDWPLIFAGYNSLKFDEPFLQNCLHQNLQEPFMTSMSKKWGEEKNSKIDILNMVKAVKVFAPDLLTLEEQNAYGSVSISLGNVCRQNNIDLSEEAAHDAMADVRATLALAKKIKDEAPEVWEQMMTMRSRDKVDFFLGANAVFGYSYAPKRGSYEASNIMATSIAQNEGYANEHIVFDLSFDPADYLDKSVDELADIIKGNKEDKKTEPLRILRKNQQPILMPLEMSKVLMPNDIDEETLKLRAKMVQSNPDFQKKVAKAAKLAQPTYDNGTEPEQQMFEFVDRAHKKDLNLWIESFREGSWQERQKLVEDFPKRFKAALEKQPSIKRFMTFAQRIIYADAPETMSKAADTKYSSALLKRLSSDDADTPWITFKKAHEQLDDIVKQRDNGEERWQKVTDEQVKTLHDYYNTLAERLTAKTAQNDNTNKPITPSNNKRPPNPAQ